MGDHGGTGAGIRVGVENAPDERAPLKTTGEARERAARRAQSGLGSTGEGWGGGLLLHTRVLEHHRLVALHLGHGDLDRVALALDRQLLPAGHQVGPDHFSGTRTASGTSYKRRQVLDHRALAALQRAARRAGGPRSGWPPLA